jgi:hypothetical protein
LGAAQLTARDEDASLTGIFIAENNPQRHGATMNSGLWTKNADSPGWKYGDFR